MSRAERLALYIALTALTAFAIDGILPVMPAMEMELAGAGAGTAGWLVTVFVLGMAVGEPIAGPVSDAVGRRPVVVAGLCLFAAGTAVAAMGDTYQAVVLGRFVQGIGVAGPKIGTRAMIRDRHAGSDMARVLSAIFTILILVPMVAPALGAAIAASTGWRGLFWSYLALAAGLAAWLLLRQRETHPPQARTPLRPRRLLRDAGAILRRRDVTPIVVATGFVFGAQLTYFAVAADIFGRIHGRAGDMPLLFALLATGMGAALALNARIVGRTGMERPIFAGLALMASAGTALVLAGLRAPEAVALNLLLILGWIGFFGLGLLFGNLNALAMRPLGALAGLGSSIIAAGSSMFAFVFATAIEMAIDDPVLALGAGFALAGTLSLPAILLSIRARQTGRPG